MRHKYLQPKLLFVVLRHNTFLSVHIFSPSIHAFSLQFAFYTQKAGSYNVSSHLISYKQIGRAQNNMRSFLFFGGGVVGGGRVINWLVTICVLAIEPLEVSSQYSNFRFALLRLKVEWHYCSLSLLSEKLNDI